SLVTLDNQEAKFEVGQDVPFLTGQFSNTGVATANGQVNPFQTIERHDVGLKLGITPTINAGDTIRLKIDLEDSSLSSGTAGTANLITNKRTLTNTVLVESGQILVIGGLIDNQLNQQKNGVPFLSDIPLLGALFTHRTESRTKRNLMVFIHPVILRNSDDAGYYSRLKYGEQRRAQLNATTGGAPLVGGSQPVLYPWNDYLKLHNKPAGSSTLATPATTAATPAAAHSAAAPAAATSR
ncbi:MAG: type II secretion system protein GspD, partial [Gammaproteobacteria bacterium]|nr:type II secretion system protein GspD [Gammaproteobacteria bacterium]